MRKLTPLTLVTALIVLSAPLHAQNADPFGGPGADPFGSGAADPFGGKAKAPAARQLEFNRVERTRTGQDHRTSGAKTLAVSESSEAEEQIRASLDDRTTQTFVELPLEDAVRQLSESHDIPMVVDKRALEELGISSDTPVSLSLHNVSLRSFLRLMLRDLDLTYMVKSEVMQITTKQVASHNIFVEMYRFTPELTEKSDKVVTALTASVEPDAWDVQGGRCSVTAIDNVLVVSANESIHAQVSDFMQKLQRAFEKNQANR